MLSAFISELVTDELCGGLPSALWRLQGREASEGWSGCVPSLALPTKAEGAACLSGHPTRWASRQVDWGQTVSSPPPCPRPAPLHPNPVTAPADGLSPLCPLLGPPQPLAFLGLRPRDSSVGPRIRVQGERLWLLLQTRGSGEAKACRELSHLQALRTTGIRLVTQVPEVHGIFSWTYTARASWRELTRDTGSWDTRSYWTVY